MYVKGDKIRRRRAMTYLDFKLISVEKKNNISFMTTMERELFPTKMPRNRFGNEICPLRGSIHRGPGCYENEEVKM